MKILSWDVGIKDLAFCVIDYKNDDNWSIIEWGIIDLTKNNLIKCCGTSENNSECSVKPSLYTDIDGEIKYYCKNHFPKKEPSQVLDFSKTYKKYIGDDKCCWKGKNCTSKSKYIYNNETYCTVHAKSNLKKLQKLVPDKSFVSFDDHFKKDKCKEKCCWNSKVKCTKNSQYIHENNYYCTPHAKTLFKKIEKSYEAKKIKFTKASQMSLSDIATELFKELDKRGFHKYCEYVLIENQPDPNLRMNMVSQGLLDYFLIRGLIDKDNGSVMSLVRQISASNKLKLVKDEDKKDLLKIKEEINKIKNGDNKNKGEIGKLKSKHYNETKKVSRDYCYKIVGGKWLDFYNQFNNDRKDDLSDALLQGLYYMKFMD